MRIAMISSGNGGVGSFTFNIARHIGDYVDCLDLYLYVDPSRDIPHGELPDNVVVVVQSSSRFKFAVEVLRSLPKLFKYDVVHSVILSPLILFLKAFPIHDVTVVNMIHPEPVQSTSEFSISGKINELSQRAENVAQSFVTKFSDENVTVSNDSAKEVRRKWGVDPEVIYHGVEPDRFSPDVEGSEEIRDEFGVDDDEQLVIFVGILYPKKDIKTLLDAIPAILSTEEDCTFLIIGRGPDEKLVNNYINQRDLRNIVHHKSYVENIEKYYAGADIFMMPSYLEAFGIVYVEAMQSGLPVIAADIDVAREVCGEAGVFFEPRNSDDLAEVTISLLADEDQLAAVRESGLRRAGKFRWDTAAREYDKLYKRALTR